MIPNTMVWFEENIELDISTEDTIETPNILFEVS